MDMRALASAVIVTGLWVATPGTARAQVFEIGEIPKCTELVPAAIAVTNAPVSINVRIILDGVSRDAAAHAIGTAQAAYAPLGIELRASYDATTFANAEGGALIDEARSLYGGRVPSGVHAVYVITGKNLYAESVPGEPDDGLVGLADCIGGMLYPERAFAVGEALEDDPLDLGVYPIGVNMAAKTLGHELGHLLGGHHHYANCVETTGNFDDGPCTLMANFVDFEALRFDTLNALTVRGHAQLLPALPPARSAGEDGGGSLGLLELAALLALRSCRRKPASSVVAKGTGSRLAPG